MDNKSWEADLNAVPNRPDSQAGHSLPYNITTMSPTTQKLVNLYLKRQKARNNTTRKNINTSIQRLSKHAREEQTLQQLELALNDHWLMLENVNAEIALLRASAYNESLRYEDHEKIYKRVEKKQKERATIQDAINELSLKIDALRKKIADRQEANRAALAEIAERNRTTNYVLEKTRRRKSRSRKATRKTRK